MAWHSGGMSTEVAILVQKVRILEAQNKKAFALIAALAKTLKISLDKLE
jgi:hypothetical protein